MIVFAIGKKTPIAPTFNISSKSIYLQNPHCIKLHRTCLAHGAKLIQSTWQGFSMTSITADHTVPLFSNVDLITISNKRRFLWMPVGFSSLQK